MLTLPAADKASFQEPLASFNFAHSLRSGVGEEGESRPLSGVERHCCTKSAWNVKRMAIERLFITDQIPMW